MVKYPHSGWHTKLFIESGVGSISFHLSGGSIAGRQPCFLSGFLNFSTCTLLQPSLVHRVRSCKWHIDRSNIDTSRPVRSVKEGVADSQSPTISLTAKRLLAIHGHVKKMVRRVTSKGLLMH
ncbi:hypothetical protein V6N13_005352 [Hibiscus sabdariffa]